MTESMLVDALAPKDASTENLRESSRRRRENNNKDAKTRRIRCSEWRGRVGEMADYKRLLEGGGGRPVLLGSEGRKTSVREPDKEA